MEIEPIADDVKVEAGDAIIDETSASGNEEEKVSSEGEKSTDCESVAGRVAVFTDATVAQSVVNDQCHESSSGVRCDKVCMIGTSTGDTDATVARSIVSGGCHKIGWEVDANIDRAVATADG